jgi:CelD/BcsL family acetyltransferase involved in cellulose biosynthesis
MHIEVVDRFEQFSGLRSDWDAVYAADPEAHFFISWIWFEKWLQYYDDGWFILLAMPNASTPRPIAFFPLRIVDKKWKGSWFYNEIQPACRFADYTGILCHPEFEAQALPAFREHLRRLTWAQMDMGRMRISDRRLSLLLQPCNETETEIVDSKAQAGIDLFRCPYIDLPVDWEGYLTDHLSTNNRQKIRRYLRRVEQDDTFRITQADSDTIERDIDILLQLWTARWGALKGSRLKGLLTSKRFMLAGCFEHRALFLPILWKEDKPIAALAILKDAQKKALLFFFGGRDQQFKDVPPGLVLHAYSIRRAIADGFKTYDFLRGDEPYKYAFATEEYRLKGALLTTKDRRNLGGKLHPRSLPYVFRRSFELHEKGNLKEAEIGYRQILEVDPGSGKALFGLGQILAAEGKHDAAIDAFRKYVGIGAPPPNVVVVDHTAKKRGGEASVRLSVVRVR